MVALFLGITKIRQYPIRLFIGDSLFMTNNRVTLWLFGAVEILIETNNRSRGLQLFMLPLPPLGHSPPYCDKS